MRDTVVQLDERSSDGGVSYDRRVKRQRGCHRSWPAWLLAQHKCACVLRAEFVGHHHDVIYRSIEKSQFLPLLVYSVALCWSLGVTQPPDWTGPAQCSAASELAL